MTAPVIQVEALSKKYRIGARERYHTFREALVQAFTAPFHRLWRLGRRLNGSTSLNDFNGLQRSTTLNVLNDRPLPTTSHVLNDLNDVQRSTTLNELNEPDAFWALKDVSFEVHQGEVLGIIGRNGAGKTTLLKILSRITEPTEGRARIRGRVASLLEVGTGFHPELTGRENIYLNGAILGMSRAEITRKFDEIVAFAEIERFIDTPVKRYSSGMYVRLAFAVAAHLEPEILLVDEVLAVGDAEFQRKCLGRIQSITSADARTVLFVSHNMAAVEAITNRAAVLERGRVTFLGERTRAIQHYLESFRGHDAAGWVQLGASGTLEGDGAARIVEARVTSPGTACQGVFPAGSPLQFEVACSATAWLREPLVGIGIDSEMGQRVAYLDSRFHERTRVPRIGPGKFTFVCRPANLFLAPGHYRVKLALAAAGQPCHALQDALCFTVIPSDFYQCGGELGRTLVLCRQEWDLT
ncbi:MAG: ABC transporter ATP-binding protein [Planctomycetes bacterium]|nr:ABC transporter ATP-binding protein [Planctomycetota bacterium]